MTEYRERRAGTNDEPHPAAGPMGSTMHRRVLSTWRRRATVAVSAAAAAGILASAVAGPFDGGPDPADRVSMRLALQRSALSPGATTLMALVFTVEPGWHIYWRNPGDTGMPITIRSITTPPGVEIGEIIWPTPERYVHTGLADYIYTGETALIVELMAAPDAPPGAGSIHVEADWLVCKDACFPGAGAVDLDVNILPVGQAPTWNQRDSDLFLSTFERMPLPTSVAREKGVTADWDGLTLVLSAPDADALTWFPMDPYDAPPGDPVRDGAAAGPTLRVGYDDRARGFGLFTGVLVVHADGRTRAYTIETDGPGGATPHGHDRTSRQSTHPEHQESGQHPE